MFNRSGVSTVSYGNQPQIIGNTKFIGLSVILDNTAKNSSGICLAGTPLKGDFTKRDGGANAFVKASAGSSQAASDANCVLLHDVIFDGNNDANATVLIKGTVQLDKMNSTVEAMYTSYVIAALAGHGIDCINPTPAS